MLSNSCIRQEEPPLVVHYVSITKNRKTEEVILQGKGEQTHLAANIPKASIGPYTHPLSIEMTENENLGFIVTGNKI